MRRWRKEIYGIAPVKLLCGLRPLTWGDVCRQGVVTISPHPVGIELYLARRVIKDPVTKRHVRLSGRRVGHAYGCVPLFLQAVEGDTLKGRMAYIQHLFYNVPV